MYIGQLVQERLIFLIMNQDFLLNWYRSHIGPQLVWYSIGMYRTELWYIGTRGRGRERQGPPDPMAAITREDSPSWDVIDIIWCGWDVVGLCCQRLEARGGGKRGRQRGDESFMRALSHPTALDSAMGREWERRNSPSWDVIFIVGCGRDTVSIIRGKRLEEVGGGERIGEAFDLSEHQESWRALGKDLFNVSIHLTELCWYLGMVYPEPAGLVLFSDTCCEA